jgi:NAD(P)-dependent dehydrogenase (short-subunit alcohol dehydrogenase family)
MDVNVNGTFNVTHAFLPALKATRGTIVNIASIAAYAGQGGSLGYSPSKGAIKLLTQSFAAELAKDGVRVNAFAPGVIETPMTTATRENPERLEKFLGRFCASLGEPQPQYDDPRVAAAVRFATAVAQHPRSVSDATFDPLREHFSAEEIVELSAWISFMYGAELFGAFMDLDPATEAQKKANAAWLAHGARQARPA